MLRPSTGKGSNATSPLDVFSNSSPEGPISRSQPIWAASSAARRAYTTGNGRRRNLAFFADFFPAAAAAAASGNLGIVAPPCRSGSEGGAQGKNHFKLSDYYPFCSHHIELKVSSHVNLIFR